MASAPAPAPAPAQQASVSGGPAQERARLALEHQIEEFTETLRQVGIVASSFQKESQPVLNAKLTALVAQMQLMDQLRQDVNIEIPLELLRYTDEDINPQVFTRDAVLETAQKNQNGKATIDMFQKFKSLIESELANAMPDDYAVYQQQLLSDSPPPSSSPSAMGQLQKQSEPMQESGGGDGGALQQHL